MNLFQDFKTEIPTDRARLAKGGKLFLLVALIAVVLTVGGILLVKTMQPAPVVQIPPPTLPSLQPQVLDTSGWQTYRSELFGFEMMFPPSWYLKEIRDRSNQQSPDNIFFSPEEITVSPDSEGPFVPISISIYYTEGQGLDIERHIESAQRQRENPKIKEIALGGKMFTKVSGILADNTYPSGQFSSIALHGENGIVISVLYTKTEGVEPETFDQILSTFRFVKQKPVIPTDKQSCEAKGGTWEITGLLQIQGCVLPTSDAGEFCTDSSQCESVCITDGNILPNTKTTGKCYDRTDTVGACLNYVIDGEAQGTLCKD